MISFSAFLEIQLNPTIKDEVGKGGMELRDFKIKTLVKIMKQI
jgi:hypothetical protein